MDENLTPDPADEEDTSQAPIAPSTPEFEAAQEADDTTENMVTHTTNHTTKHMIKCMTTIKHIATVKRIIMMT